MTIFFENVVPSINVLNWFLENNTCQVDEKMRDEYILLKNNIKAEAIHGNKAQNARQRALTNFKAQTTRVLVATDIAARGIDVDELA
jgi:superfamily II DNA/RNA helicase